VFEVIRKLTKLVTFGEELFIAVRDDGVSFGIGQDQSFALTELIVLNVSRNQNDLRHTNLAVGHRRTLHGEAHLHLFNLLHVERQFGAVGKETVALNVRVAVMRHKPKKSN
jgi:hypothetical protein